MAHFVMIHGAWHGGWCFDGLRPIMEPLGHAITAPDLPGMGGNAAELAAVTLAGWTDFVSEVCYASPEPVILCGHSRGGIVISEVAERIPGKIKALVYICAMMLPSGMSRLSWRELASPNPDFVAIQKPREDGLGLNVDIEAAAPVFAQLSPPHLVKDALARLVTEPDRPRNTALSLSPERYGKVPRHYIECLHDRTIPLADQRKMQELSPGTIAHQLDADHSPYLSAPEQLSKLLDGIAVQ